MIFDEIERSEISAKRQTESYFEYYNQSNRLMANNIRALLEDFISRYPGDEVDELVARMRSGNDDLFFSAVFELILHEILLKQGCILLPHPELPNSSTSKPDFLVTTREGEQFYLEAVLARQNNDIEEGAESRKGAVYDVLSQHPHKNFILLIDEDGDPRTQPSTKKLVREINGWLDFLDPDEIEKVIAEQDIDHIEPYVWRHEGWTVKFTPWPLRHEKRGASKNLIGAGAIKSGFVNDWEPIRDTVKSKGSKYGQLDKPFVIAVNMLSGHLDRIDEMQALYGQEQFIFVRGSEAEPRMEREPNGAWIGKGGPHYTRVSGVWIFDDLRPSTLASRRQTLYINPWASNPIPDFLKFFPHAIAVDDVIKWVEGVCLRDLVGVPDTWPE